MTRWTNRPKKLLMVEWIEPHTRRPKKGQRIALATERLQEQPSKAGKLAAENVEYTKQCPLNSISSAAATSGKRLGNNGRYFKRQDIIANKNHTSNERTMCHDGATCVGRPSITMVFRWHSKAGSVMPSAVRAADSSAAAAAIWGSNAISLILDGVVLGCAGPSNRAYCCDAAAHDFCPGAYFWRCCEMGFSSRSATAATQGTSGRRSSRSDCSCGPCCSRGGIGGTQLADGSAGSACWFTTSCNPVCLIWFDMAPGGAGVGGGQKRGS